MVNEIKSFFRRLDFKKIALGAALVATFFSHFAFANEKKTLGKVFLIHGFLRSASSMNGIQKYLESKGWEVVNWDYPSRDHTIQEHAHLFAEQLKKETQNSEQPIFFVTHSMGGLILRAALNDPSCPEKAKEGKAVLLAPPNRGANMGRKINHLRFAQLFCKPHSGKQLLTTDKDGFESLGEFPPKIQLMIISGTLSINPLLSTPNDGIVELEETYLLSTPFIHKTVKTTHALILSNKTVMQYIDTFFTKDQ